MAYTNTILQTIGSLLPTFQSANLISSRAVSKLTSLLLNVSSAAVGDIVSITEDELCDLGFISKQGMILSESFFDDAVSMSAGVSSLMKITYSNPVYPQDVPITILGCFSGASTLRECFQFPLMDAVMSNGFATMKDYANSHYLSSTSSALPTSFDVVIEYDGQSWTILTLSKQDGFYIVTLPQYSNLDTILTLLRTCLNAASVSSLFSEGLVTTVTTLLSGVTTISDLRASLDKYINSDISIVSQWFKEIFASSGSTVLTIAAQIADLIRRSRDFHEDSSGNLVWNNHSTRINTSIWSCLGTALSQAAQVIGATLMYTGKVGLMILGGALTIAGGSITALLQATGTVTGTVPTINPEVCDYVYSDPIASGENIKLPNKFDWGTDLGSDLQQTGKGKIITNFGVLYLYNYKKVGNDHFVDYKIFPNVNGYSSSLYNYGVNNNTPALDKLGFQLKDINGGVRSIIYRNCTQDDFKQFCNEIANTWVPVSFSDLYVFSGDAADYGKLWTVLAANALLCVAFFRCSVYNPTDESPDEEHRAADPIRYTALVASFSAYLANNSCGEHYTNIVNVLGNAANRDLGYTMNGFGPLIGWLSNLGYLTERVTFAEYSSEQEAQDVSGYIPGTTGIWDDRIDMYNTFILPDRYAYVTPPTHDLKTILWSAVMGAIVVGAITVTVLVARKVISKATNITMTRKGQALLKEGETFRVGWTEEEWKQLSTADRAEYNKAFKSYQFKVKIFNVAAGLLGTGSLDWINNWWNGAESSIPNPTPSGMNQYGISDLSSTATPALAGTTGAPQTINPVAVRDGTQQITIVDVYNAVTGQLSVQPQN